MKWGKKSILKLKKLYRNGTPMQEIAHSLQRTTGAIEGRLRLLAIRRNRSLPKLKIPAKITPALARIHAHICGDGNLFRYREKDCYGYLSCYKSNPYRERYGVCYTNLNSWLIKEFMEDIKSTFSIKPFYYRDFVRVKSMGVWKLLKRLGAGKSRDWFIATEIINGSKEIKRHWIRAFFDDEACFNDAGRIRVRSVNRNGLTQLMGIVKEFVPCHITPKEGKYLDGSVYLNINKKDTPKFFYRISSLRYKGHKR